MEGLFPAGLRFVIQAGYSQDWIIKISLCGLRVLCGEKLFWQYDFGQDVILKVLFAFNCESHFPPCQPGSKKSRISHP